MNILVIGSGGREHTFCWKLAQSPLCSRLFAAPGNAGTAHIATNLAIGVTDFEHIKKAVIDHRIDMVIVGPEAPLVDGIHDFFLADAALKNLPVVGPQKAAAALEGSKEFAKAFMQRHGIPTARYASFTKETAEEGCKYLTTMQPPYVLKADGLAAGKGVLIISDLAEAQKALREMLIDQKFGAASEKVVIEEFLSGIELSCFVLTDGATGLILPMAKDYKRIGEGDTGLNTGGMGAVSPVPFADETFVQKIKDRIVTPTLEGLQKDQLPYKGFIFIGLINVGGDPYVIEYNVRMGDPDTVAVLPRVTNDWVELMQATANGTLHNHQIAIDPRAATTVVAVSGGYPENYQKGKEIRGLVASDQVEVFHAGTVLKEDQILTSGGRVLAVTALGDTIQDALDKTYLELDKISYDQMYYRKDIGKDLL
ncbi:MAG: phosphoribosylamine--glycine ligase [Flavobacteriaceae bacterium]